MFKKPAINTKVIVTTDWSDYLKPFINVPQTKFTQIGTVLESDINDDFNSFRITTDNPQFPIAIISLDSIIELKRYDGTKIEKETKKENNDQSWVVEGKHGTYVVTKKGNLWSCDCKGFQFRKTCRHINEKKKTLSDEVS